MIEWLLSSLTEIVWRPMPSPGAMAKYDRKAMVVIRDVTKWKRRFC